MFESAQSFVGYVFAHDWALYIALFLICFVVVLFVSAIKYIVMAANKQKQTENDKKKLEYAYAVPAFIATFGITFGFMYVHKGEDMSIAVVVAKAVTTSFMTEGIYLFLCQSPRKIYEKIKTWIKNLVDAYKHGKLTTKKVIEETEKLLDTNSKEESKADIFYKLVNKE